MDEIIGEIKSQLNQTVTENCNERMDICGITISHYLSDIVYQI